MQSGCRLLMMLVLFILGLKYNSRLSALRRNKLPRGLDLIWSCIGIAGFRGLHCSVNLKTFNILLCATYRNHFASSRSCWSRAVSFFWCYPKFQMISLLNEKVSVNTCNNSTQRPPAAPAAAAAAPSIVAVLPKYFSSTCNPETFFLKLFAAYKNKCMHECMAGRHAYALLPPEANQLYPIHAMQIPQAFRTQKQLQGVCTCTHWVSSNMLSLQFFTGQCMPPHPETFLVLHVPHSRFAVSIVASAVAATMQCFNVCGTPKDSKARRAPCQNHRAVEQSRSASEEGLGGRSLRMQFCPRLHWWGLWVGLACCP